MSDEIISGYVSIRDYGRLDLQHRRHNHWHTSLGRLGSCVCRFPYYGVDCSSKYCPQSPLTGLNCSGNGLCMASTGECLCNTGWFSDDCSHKRCPEAHGFPCNNQGMCVVSAESDFWKGRCICRPPYYGDDCTLKHCPAGLHNLTCSGHGECNPMSGRCLCHEDYYGPNCDQKQCPIVNGRVCNNAGSCITKDTADSRIGSCQCQYPFFGHACEKKRCPKSPKVLGDAYSTNEECDGHGACNTNLGSCMCDRGYGGPDCTQRRCPMSSRNPSQTLLECNGEGRCDVQTGRCMCYSSLHHGDACDLRHCPFHASLECSEHGECNHHTGECRCQVGWSGSACERLGGPAQAPELSDLERGDHFSVGSPNNIYHPRGVCAGVPCTSSFPGLGHWADGLTADGEDGRVPGGRQRAGSQSGQTDSRVERRERLTDRLRDTHTRYAMENEKCHNCGNVPHQGSPGWAPPLDDARGASNYFPTGQSAAQNQGTNGQKTKGYYSLYRPYGTVHNP